MRRSLLAAARAVAAQQQSGWLCSAQPACLAQAALWQRAARPFSSSAPAAQDGGDEEVQASDKVRALAATIMDLSVAECSQLAKLLRRELGLPAGGGVPMMGMPIMAAAPAGGASAGAADAAPAAEEKKEKSEFDVKLESFSPDGKIKLIKEIRAITNLGLKEAKELVEKAPVVIKTGLSKADAEALKTQLSAVGGSIVLE